MGLAIDEGCTDARSWGYGTAYTDSEPSSNTPASRPSFLGDGGDRSDNFQGSSVNSRSQLLKGLGEHTESCEGNGHHLSSNAGPLSMHITISQRISPLSSSGVSAPSDGARLHSCTQAREGRGTLMPISGECVREGIGATAR